jgi:hypothetical protein
VESRLVSTIVEVARVTSSQALETKVEVSTVDIDGPKDTVIKLSAPPS